MNLPPDLLLALLLGSAATAAAAGLFALALSAGRRGWPLLLTGLVSAAGLWAALDGGAAAGAAILAADPASADAGDAAAATASAMPALNTLLPRLAMLLAPALLALAALEAALAARAPRKLAAAFGAGALLLAALAAIALLAGLAVPEDMPMAAAIAGLAVALCCLAVLPFAPAAAPALALAGALPGLAVLFAPAAQAGLLPAGGILLALWLLLLVLLLVRRLDLRALETRIWEQAEAEVGEEADRRVAQALAEEVNERGRLEDRLIRATTVDTVSGLATRAHFLSSARALYRQRQEAGAVPCAIAVVAVDELRDINGYYGFKGGDATLAAIGRTIRDMEEGDVPPCRWSGSRFCLWLVPKRGQSAVLLAERVRGTLSATQVPLPEGRFQVTVSVGVAEDRDGRGLDHVILAAEAALRDAEAAGGNRVASA